MQLQLLRLHHHLLNSLEMAVMVVMGMVMVTMMTMRMRTKIVT